MGILQIKEIIEYGAMTEVPMMPTFIRGVINLRGRVVPVVDLSARFGRSATTVARRTCIVIVETVDDQDPSVSQDIGIMVEAVNEVIGIAGSDIEPAPAFGTRLRPEFVSGMATRGEQFVILLEVNRVLSVEEMSELGQSFGGNATFCG